MRALVLYCLLTVVGALIAALIGVFVQRETSGAISLLVFLPLFFANFGIAWYLTRYVMDQYLAKHSRECPTCRGRGLVTANRRDSQCQACRGSGRLPLEPADAPMLGTQANASP
jgi:hypothetical protein